jgi:hypothetical protein
MKQEPTHRIKVGEWIIWRVLPVGAVVRVG